MNQPGVIAGNFADPVSSQSVHLRKPFEASARREGRCDIVISIRVIRHRPCRSAAQRVTQCADLHLVSADVQADPLLRKKRQQGVAASAAGGGGAETERANPNSAIVQSEPRHGRAGRHLGRRPGPLAACDPQGGRVREVKISPAAAPSPSMQKAGVRGRPPSPPAASTGVEGRTGAAPRPVTIRGNADSDRANHECQRSSFSAVEATHATMSAAYSSGTA